MTERSPETDERLAKLSRSSAKHGPAALKSRLLVGGAALGAGLAMVGGMTASAQTTPVETSAPTNHIVRVVVDSRLGNPAAPDLPIGPGLPANRAEVDDQTAAPTPAPAPLTESGGS